MNNASDSAIATTSAPRTVELDPILEARITEKRREEARNASLRERIIRERRVLFPMLAIALLALPNFRMGQVTGKSMEPRFFNNDRLVILKTYKWFAPLQVGDVVIVHLKRPNEEEQEIVKRVVFIQNATGDAQWPEYIANARGRYRSASLFPREVGGFKEVPPNTYYVLGDNVDNSADSRDDEIGAIREEEIVGKVINL
jgi:signal peptidase I